MTATAAVAAAAGSAVALVRVVVGFLPSLFELQWAALLIWWSLVAASRLRVPCARSVHDATDVDANASRLIFVSPFPLRDLVISEFEIARAKAAGAAGVTVVLALVGAERAVELAAFCKKLGGCVGGRLVLVGVMDGVGWGRVPRSKRSHCSAEVAQTHVLHSVLDRDFRGFRSCGSFVS